jgi:hypothetical protein
MATLPIDIWLVVFHHIANPDTLWSTVRNVSQYLSACVEEYFRHSIIRESVILLFYSTLHTSSTSSWHLLYVPMRFKRLSNDETRAVFQQARWTEYASSGMGIDINGSLRGWVPFIERYYKETKKPVLRVDHRSKGTPGPQRWEEEYLRRRKEKPHREKAVYLRSLRDHTSIGRGDRPPYFINVADMMHDSELVDLVVDCKAREISFNWRRTLSAFFMERHFIVLANQNGLRHEYDKDIDSAEFDVSRIEWTRKSFQDRHCDYWRQARRKSMQPWTKKNKKRISKVLRLMTEDTAVRLAQSKVLQYVRELIVDTPEDYNDPQEIVPEKCAKDYRELMLWPANKKETRQAWYELQNKQPHVCCTM